MIDVAAEKKGLSAAEIDVMRAVEDELWWYRALRSHVLECLSGVSPDFKLLDAGCGGGGMLNWVRSRFPQASLTGLDISERALEVTAERSLNARLVRGHVDQLPFSDGEFDVVLSLDVIVTRGVDDQAAIHEAHRVVVPGGRLIVNVAAFDFLRGTHDVAVNQTRRYTRKSLTRLLKEAGFKIEMLSYWNMTLLPPVAVVRWLSRLRPPEAEVRSDLAPMWPPLNTLLATIARAETALSRHVPLPFGTSLFAVARK